MQQLSDNFMAERFTVTSDKSKISIPFVHNFLTNCYWAKGRSIQTVETTIKNSYCIGVFDGEKQVGFARTVTDYSTFAYLMDVFVIEEYRGLGLSKLMMDELFYKSELKNVKRWILMATDAKDLYFKYGFKPVENPEYYFERKPDW
jgi:GNAT superfamily N-acetyltransferase